VWGAGHGVAVAFCRMQAGSIYGKHPHKSEDFAFTEPGQWRQVTAVRDCVMLLSVGQPS